MEKVIWFKDLTQEQLDNCDWISSGHIEMGWKNRIEYFTDACSKYSGKHYIDITTNDKELIKNIFGNGYIFLDINPHNSKDTMEHWDCPMTFRFDLTYYVDELKEAFNRADIDFPIVLYYYDKEENNEGDKA